MPGSERISVSQTEKWGQKKIKMIPKPPYQQKNPEWTKYSAFSKKTNIPNFYKSPPQNHFRSLSYQGSRTGLFLFFSNFSPGWEETIRMKTRPPTHTELCESQLLLHILAKRTSARGFCPPQAKGQHWGAPWDFLRLATVTALLSFKCENYSWWRKIHLEKYFLILVAIREEKTLFRTTNLRSTWLPRCPERGPQPQLSCKHGVSVDCLFLLKKKKKPEETKTKGLTSTSSLWGAILHQETGARSTGRHHCKQEGPQLSTCQWGEGQKMSHTNTSKKDSPCTNF